ncbi:unnamed protein product [Lactuca saligna]|uniref:Uncharacterized protein n=1 Tax=Lactuca saligna TaxID=75948 RepID=A0AA35YXW5_LACSI|nr:unnamed protein product [Lactuca saligna]
MKTGAPWAREYITVAYPNPKVNLSSRHGRSQPPPPPFCSLFQSTEITTTSPLSTAGCYAAMEGRYCDAAAGEPPRVDEDGEPSFAKVAFAELYCHCFPPPLVPPFAACSSSLVAL